MRLTKDQQQLRDIMSDTSELCYCAGWMDGTEFRLWQFVTDSTDAGEWGFCRLEPELRNQLRELSQQAGGWVIFPDDDSRSRDRHGNSFVSLNEWLDMFEAWKTRPHA